MDLNILNGWLILFAGGCGVVLWWLFRTLHARVERAEQTTAALALHVAEEYVSVKRFDAYSDRFDAAVGAIFAKLDKVYDKLEAKADKK